MTNPGKMKMCDFSDRKFKIVVLRKLSKFCTHTNAHTDRKATQKLSVKFNNDIEIILKIIQKCGR